ncbi:unnamed protein product [Adineta ricciae]|uniref:Succinate dehydrogenase assembly factor 2, mitochondrial n=1 Tax=Adineta ricciae TaxID=249248 RepID=A0A815ZCP9_ADIRI|nr:unnamed protein product [Adineta ricciae]
MTARLSLYTCWLPRTTGLQRIFIRSSFSDASETNPSSHRSASRFSLKIARFFFKKDRLEQSARLSTHAHYTKSETPGDIHELARDFILSLEPDHRRILSNELVQVEKLSIGTTAAVPILTSQLAVVFIETGLPYIGFGFVDNFVMIVAGETIETFLGAAFCLSTMAAAALGNAVSDVMGIGLADRIERTCGRFLSMFGINPPKLTTVQWSQRSVQVTQLMSKIICIFVGCILVFTLLVTMNFLRTVYCPIRSVGRILIRQSHLESTSEQLPVWTQPKNEPLEVQRRRLLYQSRKRGMLENDLLLSNFASIHLPKMNAKDLDLYDKLINTPSNDWDLYYMAIGKIDTPEEYQHPVMDLLKDFVKNEEKQMRIRQPDLVPV